LRSRKVLYLSTELKLYGTYSTYRTNEDLSAKYRTSSSARAKKWTNPKTANMNTENTPSDLNTQHISSLLQQGLINYRQEVQRYQKGRECERPDFSRFKLKIWWRDGNDNVFFSYDYDYHYPNGIKTRKSDDEKLGLWKLLKYLGEQKQADTFRTAMIWMSFDTRPATASSSYDFCIAKSLRGQKGKKLPELTFENGKVNMNLLRESLDKKLIVNFNPEQNEYVLTKFKANPI